MKTIEQSNSQIFCRVQDLGLIEYNQAYKIQKQCVEKVLQEGHQYLILCEHLPVLTLGRLATRENILWSQKEIEKKGIKVWDIDRGGEVTLHSPGQLVIYPIFDLNYFGKDLKSYLYKLEKVAIDLLNNFGIVASRIDGKRGIWVAERKIVSLGIGVRKWVAFHGMAINVHTDLKLFSSIKPCGLDVPMTSMKELTGQEVDFVAVKKMAIQCFVNVFGLKVISNGV